MKDEDKTKEQLIHELADLRQRIDSLEKSEIERQRPEEALRKNERAAQRLAKENEIIAEVGRIISSTWNIEEVYQQFAKEVSRLLPFDRVAVNLLNPDGKTITVTYIAGIDIPGLGRGDVFPLDSSILGKIIQTRSGLLIQPDAIEELEGRFHHIITVFQAGLRSILSAPLIFREQIIGALHFRSKKSKAYTEQDLLLAERIAAQIAGAIANSQLFLESKKTEETLKKREQELKVKSHNLEEVNTTLKVLLRQREEDIVEVEEKVLSNVKELILPYLEKLKKVRPNDIQLNYLDIVETNLYNIISPFLKKLKSKYLDLTSKEIQIANLIREGKTTKEIAELLHVSPRAIEFHRDNIRTKLGLKNKKANLNSYLSSLP
jgi:GAF domain-containing protein/DNA-binding CsgD family transcriptional regulator